MCSQVRDISTYGLMRLWVNEGLSPISLARLVAIWW